MFNLRARIAISGLASASAALLALNPGAAASAQLYEGVPASRQAPGIAATLRVEYASSSQVAEMELIETASPGRPIRTYDTDMTKLMHLVVIGSDFRYFAHLHPSLDGAGRFHLRVQLPPGSYHFYADGEPAGYGDQVFRFDAVLGQRSANPLVSIPMRAATQAGPYTVSLSTLTVPAGREAAITVRVAENGAPARDLHPYLGAVAHAIFIDTRTLAYAHVHPAPLDLGGGASDMPTMTSGPMPEMTPMPSSAAVAPAATIRVDLPSPGLYRLWYQFDGGSGTYVATFAIEAR